MKLTYHGLAERILTLVDKPLTPNEIWQEAVNRDLTDYLNSQGKTPWATLGSRLYVIVKENPKSNFGVVGKRPKRFYLKDKQYTDFEQYQVGKLEDEFIDKPVVLYHEKDLHQFLAYFARLHLNCYSKTINHSKSTKKEYGGWVHPDMVGCAFPIDEWDNEVLGLSSAIGNTSIKVYSFEIKKEINLSTLREKFFQTVSNSSWANESYLVAAEISNNEDFLVELSRLSTSFGIGVIKLDITDPDSSGIILPARYKDNLDWETINKLTMNPDFKNFLKRIRIDLNSSEVRKEQYDKVLEVEQLTKIIAARNKPYSNEIK